MYNQVQFSPKVSVVIPVYNAAGYIRRAVDSVLNQSHIVEIILVDDGSKDDSLTICNLLQEENSIIRVLSHPNFENKGPSATKNLGWKKSKGDWIQFLDADDELLEGKLAHQVSLIDQDIPVIIANSFNKFENGMLYPRTFKKDIWIGLILGKLGITSANLFNRKYLELTGGFDERLYTSEEYDLMFKIFQLNPSAKFDTQKLTLIHQAEGSITRSGKSKDKLLVNWVNLRKSIRAYLRENNQFSIKKEFYYSGSMGTFQISYGQKLDPSINKLFYFLYSFQINIKTSIVHFLKKIHGRSV